MPETISHNAPAARPTGLSSALSRIERIPDHAQVICEQDHCNRCHLRVRPAYQATAKHRAEMFPADLLPITLDVQQAIGTVIAVLPKLRILREETKATFRTFDFEQFDSLEAFAGALSYAQSGYGAASAPNDGLPAMAERAAELRDRLRDDATILGRRNLIDAKPLEELEGGNGYLNVAADLGVLARMLRARWADVKGKSAVEESELVEAQKLVESMTFAHASRTQSSEGVTAAASDRQRAYTLMVKAYDEARRAAMYVRYHQDDAATYLPSLWAGRGGKRGASPVAAPSAPAIDADAPTVPDGDLPVVPTGDVPVVPMHG